MGFPIFLLYAHLLFYLGLSPFLFTIMGKGETKLEGIIIDLTLFKLMRPSLCLLD